MANSTPLMVQAIQLLEKGDRDGAIALVRQDMDQTTRGGDRWRSIAGVMQKIGEINLAIEAARRFAATEPCTLDRTLFYWSVLADYGRERDVLDMIDKAPANWLNSAPVLHLRGTLAAGAGDEKEAERLFRESIARAGVQSMSWFPLGMVKRFTPDDPDLVAMTRRAAQLKGAPADVVARQHYAIGKAHLDCGDFPSAMESYAAGAAVRRSVEPFDFRAFERLVRSIITTMNADFLKSLAPSQYIGSQALFVTGLPRTGSTLIEQILSAHSKVADGGEINLFDNALLPVQGRDAIAARLYQEASESKDPWGDIARTYERLLSERFRTDEHVVDKTLMQSLHMGLLLHAIPDAKVVWLRRNSNDSAWSTYRNYFTSSMPWTWSLEDIGRVYRLEDELHAHWAKLFPDRILSLKFEDFVRAPEEFTPKMLDHFGLAGEDVLASYRGLDRQVRTASVSQVRHEIDPAKIGQAEAIDRWLKPFRDAYVAD